MLLVYGRENGVVAAYEYHIPAPYRLAWHNREGIEAQQLVFKALDVALGHRLGKSVEASLRAGYAAVELM